jgi:hypothetical protein
MSRSQSGQRRGKAPKSKSLNGSSSAQARLIIDANCTTCGPIDEARIDPFRVPQAAFQHAAQTGHIVILNGTADLPRDNAGA